MADSLELIYQSDTSQYASNQRLLYLLSFNCTQPERRNYYANLLLQSNPQTQKNLWFHHAYLMKSYASRMTGDYEQGIEYGYEAISLAQKINHNTGIASGQIAIGDIFSVMNNHANAVQYYNQGITHFRVSGDSTELAMSLLNTGDQYLNHNQYDSALIYLEEALLIFEVLESQSGIAYALGNLGMAQSKLNLFVDAKQNLTHSIKILKNLQDFYPIVTYQLSLAELFIQKNQLEKAKSNTLQALNISKELGLKEQTRDAYLLLSKIYEEQDSVNLAYTNLKNYNDLMNLLNSDGIIQNIANKRTDFEVGKRQKIVNFLNEQSSTNMAYIIVMGLMLFMLCIISIILYKTFREKVKSLDKSRVQEQAISEQKESLDQMNKLKDQFFSVISHDLRTPLGNLTNIADLIDYHLKDQSYKELPEINNLLRETNYDVSFLLENLLNWAVTQQNNIPIRFERTSTKTICNPSLKVLRWAAARKNIEMTKDLNEDIWMNVDEDTLATAIRNLISNAIKFTPKNGKVDVHAFQRNGEAIISIKDNGIGIPPDKMETLFTFTGERKRWGTAGEKGVGLGLNLVKEFVDKNKGRIEVISKEDTGSEFIVYLPLAG
ncbi:MAG: ATP-binding protein [Reichenbachiella sp.]